MRQNIQTGLSVALALGALSLAGCNAPEDAPEPEASPSEGARSIFADDTAQSGLDPTTLPPLETTLSFADGTPDLTQAVSAELATILGSPQIEAGGRIVLRGHTDSQGDDDLNLETSRSMAEAVSDFLIEGGIAEERIAIIAFGDQNPIAPNAMPNGAPNEEGRATNRRVEVTIETGRSPAREQTLIETLSEGGDAGDADPVSVDDSSQ